MIDRLRWLHISDLHFVADGDAFSQRVATKALLEDAQARVGGQEPVCFVLVTGDIAFSGQPAEYDVASAFLSDFASAVGVSPRRFFFVPGNHDIDRSKQRLAYHGACSELTSQAEVDRLLGSPNDLGPLIGRQAGFRAFVDAFTHDQERSQTADGLAFVAPLVIGGLRLTLLGLNSAWLSGKDPEENEARYRGAPSYQRVGTGASIQAPTANCDGPSPDRLAPGMGPSELQQAATTGDSPLSPRPSPYR